MARTEVLSHNVGTRKTVVQEVHTAGIRVVSADALGVSLCVAPRHLRLRPKSQQLTAKKAYWIPEVVLPTTPRVPGEQVLLSALLYLNN